MKILCDIDGVLAQFTEHLSKYLCDRGVMYRINDFSTYNLVDCIEPKHRYLIDQAAHNKGWCFSVPRYEGAQQFLKDLVAKGHQVRLVTSNWTKSPHWTQARTEWCESLLSSPALRGVEWQFATPEERVRMDGDVLIDDRFETCASWRLSRRDSFLMARPWNAQGGPEKCVICPKKDGSGPAEIIRANSYKEILECL